MGIQKDGYQTTIGFSALASGVVFNIIAKEKTITPPAIESDAKIDLTTMRNEKVRTFYPRQLYTLGDSTIVVAWDPLLYAEMAAVRGVNQTITITFPDDTFLSYWGSLDGFVPNDQEEGVQPTAVLTVSATNLNDSDEETEPTWPTT